MKPLSEHLVALIATAEDILRAPCERQLRLPPGFAEVASAIRHAHARPAEGIRATYGALICLDAIEAFAYAPDDAWQAQIGAVLPRLRRDAWTALRQEKEQQLERADG